MTRTGPQKIPGATFDMFFGDGQYSGSDLEVNCAVAHTTEGPTLYNYRNGAEAPTVTAVPDFRGQRLVWHQHFDVDESARALVNAPGGVQTNLANAFQVELVGTCDPATHAEWTRDSIEHIYWPQPPDWAVRDLAWLMRWLHDNHSVPLTSGLTFKPYPDSYGANNGVRMSFDAWTRFTGWAGHMHVPENLHGDPGALPINRLLAVAAGTNTPSEEDDMAISDDDVHRIAWAVVQCGTPDLPQEIARAVVERPEVAGLVRTAAAQAAAITALAGQLGQVHGVDTATVVAEVRKAIADTVLHVQVDVTQPAPTKS